MTHGQELSTQRQRRWIQRQNPRQLKDKSRLAARRVQKFNLELPLSSARLFTEYSSESRLIGAEKAQTFARLSAGALSQKPLIVATVRTATTAAAGNSLRHFPVQCRRLAYKGCLYPMN